MNMTRKNFRCFIEGSAARETVKPFDINRLYLPSQTQT
jgi:hypothetical protein